MTTLREAATMALEALEGKRYTACGWRADCDKAITALRAALVEDAMQKFTDVNQELEAALAEPTPLEDVVTHGSAWSKDGKRIDPMSVYAEPVQEPVAWYHIPHPGNGMSPLVSLSQQCEPSMYAASVPLYLKEQL